MKAYILYDKEFQTDIFKNIYTCLKEYLADRGFEVVERGIGKGDLAYCTGCFGCWIKSPGECTIGDRMKEINHAYMNSDVTIYLCPVVFGEFSANIKNALDRWIPNVLPFFVIRKDGSTFHPSRYNSYPTHVMVAYADLLDQEDVQLFTDIQKKHREAVELIIYGNSTEDLRKSLDHIELKRAGAKL